MAERVAAERISGFPEWLPEQKLVEEAFLRTIRGVFERFGFTPIETPAVERTAVLTAKGGVEKEIYALTRLAGVAAAGAGSTASATPGDRLPELALHFDLTVPTARYVAQHFGKLCFPFRRYQIQKVWRGERPQAGRFREFYQCDIDIIGHESLSLLNDAEILCVIDQVFTELGVGDFRIRINNRKILEGYLDSLGLGDSSRGPALRILDSLEKVGREQVATELRGDLGLSAATIDGLLHFLQSSAELGALDCLAMLRRFDHGQQFALGVEELGRVLDGLTAFGVSPQRYAVDVSIARGLDYYTGTVYETRLLDAPQLGSVCSGGRYDDLAANFTTKRLPGVGISIGLTRLLSQLFEAGVVKVGKSTTADVLVTVMNQQYLPQCIALAAQLRLAGIATELFTEPKNLGAQLKYAARKGFAVVVLLGDSEVAEDRVTLRHMATAKQSTVARHDLVQAVVAAMAGPSALT